VRQVGR